MFQRSFKLVHDSITSFFFVTWVYNVQEYDRSACTSTLQYWGDVLAERSLVSCVPTCFYLFISMTRWRDFKLHELNIQSSSATRGQRDWQGGSFCTGVCACVDYF